jgi:hypothetical protein
MTTLMAWAAKRAIIARIEAWAEVADSDDPLYGIQIAYALPAEPERVCVYGSRVRSTRTQATGEHATLFREDITVEVRVRVFEVGGDPEDTERTAEGIAQRIAAAVSAEPRIVIGSVAVTSTDADPTVLSGDPEPSVAVNIVLTVTLSILTPGA